MGQFSLKRLGAGAVIAVMSVSLLSACVQQAPPDLVQAVEALDRQLVTAHSAEYAPEEYARFIQHWVAIKERLRSDGDLVGWPWEDNPFETDLRALQEEGSRVLALATDTRNTERRLARSQVVHLERRFRRLTSGVDRIGSRMVLGEKRVETELLVKQARSFMEQGRFVQAQRVARQADQRMINQTAHLNSELGRYADKAQVNQWRAMVRRTVDWSRQHQAAALVVEKAKRRMTLYRSGKAITSYPVRLGFNGVQEKRYEDDGATPEGTYRVIRMKDRGQTEFYRALLLDYPNADDQRRFQAARRTGAVPFRSRIGGNIEIHGEASRELSQTLGCVMVDNRQMDELFLAVGVGTPVTIVGAVDADNRVAVVLAQMGEDDDDTNEDDADLPNEQAVTDGTVVDQG